MTLSTTKRVVVLLADGARWDVMRELLASGQLPEIARWIVDPGTQLTGITTFPSTTGPAYLPFLTGASPGPCNIPGIRWFDKAVFARGKRLLGHRSYCGFESFLMGRDIAPPIQTIFELIPKSYSIFNPITRGAGRRNLTRLSRIWYWYYAHLTDRWAFVDEAAVDMILKAIRKDFQFLFAVLPGVDEFSHLSHPHHSATLARYAWLDQAVGEIARSLESRGDWETTALWIVSDHGLSKTDHHFCLNTFLEHHDLPPFFYPQITWRHGKRAANMMSGNSMSHLSFRNYDGWHRSTTRAELERLAPKLFSDLLAEPAVDILAMRNDRGGIDVASKRGEARLSLDGSLISYDVLTTDPFGFPSLPRRFDRDVSLSATVASDYPDAPYQLVKLFTAARTGDLVVSAAQGYDLRLRYENPEHRGSHGSLHASHMLVPILCNRKLRGTVVRTVDVFPTILTMLGQDIPTSVEGQSLI